jgi:Superfamily II DNA and RNA helicases
VIIKLEQRFMSSGFETLNLHPQLKKAIDALGFTSMTPIQQKVLKFTLAGHDAIGRAQTGTGKTAAFLISVINDLLNNPVKEQRYRGEPRALILAPTRELALQIESDAHELTKFTDLSVVTLLGGVDFDKQKAQLDKAPVDIMVATPGRLIDFVEQKEVWLDQIEFLVIDEADRLLDMGFIPSVKRIVRFSPRKEQRQTLMFSATFSYDVLNLAQQWLFEPVTVEIEPEKKTNADVEQRVYMVAKADKYKLLQDILRDEPIEKVMIFANRRDQVRKLYDHLKRDGYKVVMLSGEIAQDKRLKMLDQFKNGKHNIMIATDVAGRGIHVDGVSHVINFTLPEQSDDYVHRIGRTGRAGTRGVSISFLAEDDAFYLPEIEKAIGQKLPLTRLEGYC